MNINRKVAMVLFVDSKNNILLQNREGISKVGEEWGFFGGKIEEGENPVQALIREIKEELDYILNKENLKEFGEYSCKLPNNLNVLAHVYLTKFPGFEKLNQKEGKEMKRFNVSEIKNLKINELDKKVIKDFEIRNP